MRSLVLLIASWIAGLAAYAGAMRGWYGEIMSLDNWLLVGAITLLVWLVTCGLVILPILRRLAVRPWTPRGATLLAALGAALAILPVWLTVGVWYGWHPRHLLGPEPPLHGELYGASGLVLGLSLGRSLSGRTPRIPR